MFQLFFQKYERIHEIKKKNFFSLLKKTHKNIYMF
jgi:hypothetical protein